MPDLNKRPDQQPRDRNRSSRRSVEMWLDLDPTGGLAWQAERHGWPGPADDEDED